MLRNKFLQRHEWEAKLRRNGCKPLSGKPKLATAEWWEAPGNQPFTVPVEEDGRSEFWAIDRLLKIYCSDAEDTRH